MLTKSLFLSSHFFLSDSLWKQWISYNPRNCAVGVYIYIYIYLPRFTSHHHPLFLSPNLNQEALEMLLTLCYVFVLLVTLSSIHPKMHTSGSFLSHQLFKLGLGYLTCLTSGCHTFLSWGLCVDLLCHFSFHVSFFVLTSASVCKNIQNIFQDAHTHRLLSSSYFLSCS